MKRTAAVVLATLISSAVCISALVGVIFLHDALSDPAPEERSEVPDRPVRIAASRSARALATVASPGESFTDQLDIALAEQADKAQRWDEQAELARVETSILLDKSREAEIARIERDRKAREHREWHERQAAEQAKRHNERSEAATTPAAPNTPTAPAPAPQAASGDVWGRLAACESGGNPRAVNPSGKYRGAFQFSMATWHGVGMTGDPIDHSYAEQLAAAQRLQARSGWGQWPQCARKLGLL